MQINNQKKEGSIVICLFLLALGLRVAYQIFLKKFYFFYEYPSDDVLYYRQWAAAILSGSGLYEKNFLGLPLYPYFLAALMRACFNNIALVRFCHLLLGSINCYLIYRLAKDIFSKPIAMLAYFLCATNFYLIYYDGLMMPVPLIISITLLCCLFITHADKLTSPRQWFYLGLLWGLGAIGDGKLLLAFFGLLFYLLFSKVYQPVEKFLKKIFFPLSLGFVIILTLTTIRHKIILNDWIFISAESGFNFYLGNNPHANGYFENPNFIGPSHQGHDADQRTFVSRFQKGPLPPSEISKFWRKQATDFIKENPLTFGKLLIKKFLLFLKDSEYTNDMDLIFQRLWKSKLDFNPYLIIMPLALLGLLWTRSLGDKTFPINLILLSQLFIALIFFVYTRHKASILPLLILYESYALVWCAKNCFKKNFKPLIPAIIFFLIFIGLFKVQHLDANTIQFVKNAKTGFIYESKGNFHKAEQHYLQALKIKPLDSNTLFNLGNCYLKEKKYAAASLKFQKILSIMPWHADSLLNLGYVYEMQGIYSKAKDMYSKLIQLDPNALDAHFRLAQLYLKQGNCEAAKKHFSWIGQRNPVLTLEMEKLNSECNLNKKSNSFSP